MKLLLAIFSLCAAVIARADAAAVEDVHSGLVSDLFKGACNMGTCETLKNECLRTGTKTEQECVAYQVHCLQHLCLGRNAR